MTDMARTTMVLDTIAESQGPVTLTELVVRTKLPRSSVHRVVQTLERELFVVRVSERPGYVLGPGLLKFGMHAHLQIVAANRHQLVDVARKTTENVELGILCRRSAVVVDQIAAPDRLKKSTRIGKMAAPHASGLGLALLAQLPAVKADTFLGRQLHKFTPKTVVDRRALLAELEVIRHSHVAFEVERHEIGTCTVATAMRGPTGTLQAVSVVMPTHEFLAKQTLVIESLGSINQKIDPALARRQCGLFSMDRQ